MKRLTLISLMIMATLPILAGAGFAFDADTSRLIPTDSVSIYRDGKVIGEYTKEAPLPLGEVLACNGRCVIKSSTMTMVAEGETVFSIDADSGSRVITVMKGKIHFGISDLPASILFVTPQGAISADQIFLHASGGASRILEGYLAAGTESSEIGVIDGGSMKIRTHEGEILVRPGNRLLLAQADIGTGAGGAGAAAGAGGAAGMSTAAMVTAATAGAVGLTAATLIIRDLTDSDGSPSSP